jgi:hypothetical protein
MGKKGKTGQGVSAANFLPAPRKPTHAVHQGGGTRDPHALAPSGLAAWSGTPTAATGTQYKKEAARAQDARGQSNSHQVLGAAATGRIGQGASAAGFLPSQEPYDSEAEVNSKAKDVPSNTVKAANQAAMRILADNRSVHGTTALRLAGATRTAKAAPSWPGIGAYYAAWVRTLRREPTNPEAAINKDAPERAYLAVMNGDKHLSVLHHLHRWRAHNGGRSRLDGYIVAFEGEVRDAHGAPLLWRFDEEEAGLLHPGPLPASALNHASLFYRKGDKDDRFHTRWTPPPPGEREGTIKTFGRLIPIPGGWAPMFLDRLSFGVAFRRVIQLMLSADPAERSHLRPFCEGIARTCGSPDPTALDSVSALNSKWKRVAYTKALLSSATTACEGHRPASRKAPPTRQKPRLPSQFDLIFGGPAREEDGNKGWGDSWGYVRPNTPPPKANRLVSTLRGAQGMQVPVVLVPATAPVGLDIAALITTLLKAQSEAQLAQTNANHANLIAFQTVTAQVMAAKGGDKESKLTAAKRRILQACAGITHANKFEVEQIYRNVDAEGGSAEALGWILRKQLKPIPLNPHKTNIHITPQLVATIKSFNFSSNGDKTYVGCTKGITIFTVPWRTAEAINEDLAEDEYFEASTQKLVADIGKHVTSAKVELPTSLQGVVRVLNNYCCLLDVLFGSDCPHLTNVMAIRDALETHEAELEARLTSVLILHLMWRIHHDARQFFLACKGWGDGEWLPHSSLDNTVQQLVKDCSIQLMLMCPKAHFMGAPLKVPGAKTQATTWAVHAAGPQPTVNAVIPPLCQKVVAAFNRLHPSMTILKLCSRGKVRFGQLKVGKERACVNFGLLGRCSGCRYRHKVCSVPDSRQAAIVKVLEGVMATMKAMAVP